MPDIDPVVAEVVALHRAAEHTLEHRGCVGGVMFDGRSAPPWLIAAADQGFDNGHLRLAQTSGSLRPRIVLTEEGEARYATVQRRYVKSAS